MNSVLTTPTLKSWQSVFDAQPDVTATQREAFGRFLERGLPTSKLDAWKYTDLRRLAMRQFRLPEPTQLPPNKLPIDELLLPSMGGQLFLYVDGVLRSATQAVLRTPAVVQLSADAFDLLNTAFSTGCTQITVAENQIIEQPIYLAFVWTKAAGSVMSNPRVKVSLGSDGKATLVEHHIGVNVESNFTNTVLEIHIGERASLEHIRVQEDSASNFNIGSVRTTVARGASYLSHQYILGGGLARSDIHVALTGAEAVTELHGLVFAQQTQHLDVRTVVDHQVPNTRSSEDYRGIADHRGRVVFNGKVIVSKDAQQTDARQSSRNLLLSPQAEIDTRPELEIHANDVKCAHGATVGQLDATALFYLQSRGIAREEARALLTHAFATEVIERIPVPAVRDHVLSRLMSRMRSEVAS
jgi:Fe-S cluster assembly protein SufD